MRLIVATNNQSKLKEIEQILSSLDLPIVSLKDLKKKTRIVENGKTFAENAVKKALPISRLYTRDLVLGEDSGLTVDYLGGLPGVRSKRYSGNSGNQDKNNGKLLKVLAGVSAAQRSCQFRCLLALAKNGRILQIFEGKLSGRAATKAKGENGFGYDPVFYLSKYRRTVAQIPLNKKNKISHRAQAFMKLRKYLKEQTLA
jgi:XTP/dITP diphosphohydrolase